jgi:hypothetical protein
MTALVALVGHPAYQKLSIPRLKVMLKDGNG